ncbi:MAG TPA: histone deacetylase [Ktedonobacterales bacterium]
MPADAQPDSDQGEVAPLPTALVYDAAMLDHDVPEDFPEIPERLRYGMAMIEALIEEGTIPAARVLRLDAREATKDELATVHDPGYIKVVHEFSEDLPMGRMRKFATDVYLSPSSYGAALLAAGAPLIALDALGEARARNGYALVRPPGHHARPAQAMGFCVFNNVAVAARYAQQRWGWQRVMIVDFDVHHGNGTQEIFYEDGDVLYVSMHQFPWYPGTGHSSETGEGAGVGTTINIPLPAGCGWSVYDPLVRQVVWPLADKFRPDLILVSAGFDAHWKDPLGEMRLSTADFADMMLELREMAEMYCGGRLVAVQEGGYHLEALAQCMSTVLVGLTGSDGIVDNIGEPPPLDFRWNEEAIINALVELHGLAGYRRKAKRPHVRAGWDPTVGNGHDHE